MAETSFAGKTIVVTGAGRGVGRGIARRFARAGGHVVIADIDAALGEQAADALRREGGSASFEPLDVRRPEDSLALVDRVVGQRGLADEGVRLLDVEVALLGSRGTQAGLDRREDARGLTQTGKQPLLRRVEPAIEELECAAALAPYGSGGHEQAGIVVGLQEIPQRPIAPGWLWRDAKRAIGHERIDRT